MSETPSVADQTKPSEEGPGGPRRVRGGVSKRVDEAVDGQAGLPAGVDSGEIVDSGLGLGAFYAYQMARSAIERG